MNGAALEAAASLIKEFEGFRARPYKDSVGVWTIGYGSTHLADGRPVTAASAAVSEEQADALVQGVLRTIAGKLDEALKVSLTANQQAALLSFCYNLGTGAFLKSTMFRMIQAHRITAAAGQFPLWVFAGGQRLAGLVRRREAERELYLKPV